MDEALGLYVVCDGMGGHAAGEVASDLTSRTVLETIRAAAGLERSGAELSAAESGRLEAVMSSALENANARVRELGAQDAAKKGAGCTCTALLIRDGRGFVGHVGDSRIYHLPSKGSIDQLTNDHTVAARKVREGKLSSEEARRHASNNVLEKSIGSGRACSSPQLGRLTLGQEDRLVFCTDGVADGITPYTVEKTVSKPPPYLRDLNPAEAVVKEALDASGKDNITAIVVELSAC